SWLRRMSLPPELECCRGELVANVCLVEHDFVLVIEQHANVIIGRGSPFPLFLPRWTRMNTPSSRVRCGHRMNAAAVQWRLRPRGEARKSSDTFRPQPSEENGRLPATSRHFVCRRQ